MQKALLFLLVLLPTFAFGAEFRGRFFLEGDGLLHVINAKNGLGGKVRYRLDNGSYPSNAWEEVNRIFGVPKNSAEAISPRLIALLDYLQDYFDAGPVRILSGYRSPDYNENLRKKGRLAAKTSLHLEGMAADIEMDGVSPRKLWHFVRDLDCCGAGYYHGKGIHLDTGPTRFWDEKSTKVEQDLGARNKLILLRTYLDIYRPGETVHLVLARITDYPIGIRPEMRLLEGEKGEKGAEKATLFPTKDPCVLIRDRAEAHALAWKVPNDFRHDRKLRLRIDFCKKPFPEMPDRIESNPILITKR
jgi:uncharacterized protein YcbK (DUF882 family)